MSRRSRRWDTWVNRQYRDHELFSKLYLSLCRRNGDTYQGGMVELTLDTFDAERGYLRNVDDPAIDADIDRYLSRKRRRPTEPAKR